MHPRDKTSHLGIALIPSGSTVSVMTASKISRSLSSRCVFSEPKSIFYQSVSKSASRTRTTSVKAANVPCAGSTSTKSRSLALHVRIMIQHFAVVQLIDLPKRENGIFNKCGTDN
jgi:hypothetical protein